MRKWTAIDAIVFAAAIAMIFLVGLIFTYLDDLYSLISRYLPYWEHP